MAWWREPLTKNVGVPVTPAAFPVREYPAMRRDLIAVERASLLDTRNRGIVPAEVIRSVERDIDLDEARIRG